MAYERKGGGTGPFSLIKLIIIFFLYEKSLPLGIPKNMSLLRLYFNLVSVALHNVESSRSINIYSTQPMGVQFRKRKNKSVFFFGFFKLFFISLLMTICFCS